MGDLSSWHEKSVSCSPHAKKFSRISSLYSKTDKIPVTLTPKECRLNFEHSSSMPHAGQSDATNSERLQAPVEEEPTHSIFNLTKRVSMCLKPRISNRKFRYSSLLIYFLILLSSYSGVSGHRLKAIKYRGLRAAEESLSSVEAVFSTGNESIALQHVVYNTAADVLYLGGTNRLYEVTADNLEVKSVVETGPRFDSARCHASGCGPESSVSRALSDNINKVLVLDPAASTLIMCGSVSQGACHKFRTANVSLTPEYIPRSVAANDPHSSTYAFVGPERYKPWGGSEALYVGTTFTAVGDYRHDVPAVSTRNLYDLDYAESSFLKQSLLRIDVKYRDHFLVKYVYGFNASDFAYFVTVQKKSHLPGQEETGYISRLARTCITDANYDSYTEITMTCEGRHGSYNLVQDAKLASAGADLAASMGIHAGDPILVATFAPSVGHTADAENAAAVCIYSVAYIETKFNENIHMCFNGSMQYRSMEYISGLILDGKCPEAGTTGNIYSFCEVGLKISGTSPALGSALLEFEQRSLTAIQSTTTAAHTVLFLGTSDGWLIKALATGPGSGLQYSEEVVHAGSAVLPDMPLHESKQHLYVLTRNRVSKYRVERCSAHTDCNACLSARDPYCGWCSLEKRCTVASACQKASFSSPRWLSFGAGQQCIDFERIRPDRLPLDQLATVKLTIRTLPELPAGAKYQCVWGSAPPTDAQVVDQGLRCPAPAIRYRPSIPPRTDHTLVPLAVRSSETNKDFVSRNFAFYDCSRHSTCGSCVRSAWACNWCVYENTCTHNSSACGGTVVSGENVSILQLLRQNPSQLSTHGAGYCPRFWRKEDELLAPDGAPTELSLSVRNLPVPHSGQTGFQCLVSIEGATMLVSARVVEEGAGIVVCEATVYRYQAMTSEYEAHLTLVWNRDHVVDSRSLTLYKCSVLGAHRGHADCSLCVTRPSRYRCSWCGGACNYAPSCPAAARPLLSPHHQDDNHRNDDQALLVSDKCPTPRIDMIFPLAGPVEGGTLVTIEGSNLGLREEDVHDNVFIGNVPCAVRDYHISVKIICRTAPVFRDSDSQDLQFPVRVTTPAGTTTSTVKFTYTNISVSGVWPSMGPVSGGTTLSISGRFLNVGSEVTAFLDDLPCIANKTQSSSQRLVCVTSATQLPGSNGAGGGYPLQVRTLTVKLDGATRVLTTPFTYTPDPSIVDIKPLRSTWDGGRMITVHGSHLNSIQSPRITVLYNEEVLNTSVCFVHSPALMECPSPTLDQDMVLALIEQGNGQRRRRRRRARDRTSMDRTPRESSYAFEEVILDLGFIMDGVKSVQHLRKHFPEVRSHVTYVSNPVYFSFQGGLKLYKGDTLVIEGEFLNAAADESDVRVTIGTSTCNMTSLASTQLLCSPPEDQPTPTDERGVTTSELLPMVVVHVGRYQRYPLGVLRYEKDVGFLLSPEGIAGLAGGALFIVIASFIAMGIYRRKSSQAERDYKLMQLQMDSLESHVRTECKQAFAELQTDMTDLTADLQASGVPLLGLRSYIMKVFFPGVSDHPILNEPRNLSGGRSNYDVAMLQLEQLIANKHFLVVLVEALEAQKTFSIRDKVNVGSLLTVLLMGRMEYLTEILRLLLSRLIYVTAANKHPQHMLRRTETVVEKILTNWFALTMYSYLKSESGNALFLLYKAIKHQVEKGPVDAVTHDARYCLSEERLLREQITHSPVTIHLLHDDPHYEKIPYQTTYSTVAAYSEEYEEKVQVKVLDCDTISQVKGKILDAVYRNSAQSIRPFVHDLDLEWRHGQAGRVTLSDFDRTSVVQNGWCQMNTLQHYGVKDTAIMALLPRQSDSTYSSSNCADVPRNAYHIVRPSDDNTTSIIRGDHGTHKAIPEIFLTRLLSTKGTIQQFVDDFFRSILSPNDGLPPPVKWLFDLLDSEARVHEINDPEVVHAWKSNCLPLRFWVNFIKNPDFVFDVYKSPTVEASLGVVAQTFIDSCATTEHKLGKDSPSNKLLFAKDIPRYRSMVKNFYRDIASSQPVSDQELGQLLQQMSVAHMGQFNNLAALKELYIYISKYSLPILESLEADPCCRELNLAHRLQAIHYIVESFSHSGPVSPLPPSQHITSPSHVYPPTFISSPTQLTSAHLATLPHVTPTSSSGMHIMQAMPHVSSSPHITCASQHLATSCSPSHLSSSSSTHGHLSALEMSPLHHLNPTSQNQEFLHQHHGSTSSSSQSHQTLPSNSSQLSEL
ncbi:plexin-B isoform X3 [Hyalella azteca]|uniref:Plexin-B isoform X3 n=1 Tax=Hyalella azteca TaxID=294128 RepID=A0A979FHZ7_HYAAZ|nr:plexin-B isoform X3 [Hyalella azteca]